MIPPSQPPSLPSSAYSTRPPSPSHPHSYPRPRPSTSIPSGANRLPLPPTRRLPAFIAPVAMSSTLSTSSAPPGPPLLLGSHGGALGQGGAQGGAGGQGQGQGQGQAAGRPAGSRTASGRHAQFVKPFAVPEYLECSQYRDRFFTTPEPVGPYSPFLDLAPSPSGSLHPAAPPTPSSSSYLPASTRNATSSSKDGPARHRLRPRLSDGLLGASAHDGAGGGARAAPAPAGPILLPTCWDAEDRCALLDVSGDGSTVSFGGSAKYGDRDAAAVRANRPIPPQSVPSQLPPGPHAD